MKKLPTKTLENAIGVYETTLKVTGDNSEYCYGALDKVTVEFLKELKEYRDAEEQGLLLRLPCKVGDTVWCIVSAGAKVVACTILWIEQHHNGILVFSLDGGLGDVVLAHLGEKWFLTKEEAEAALEKLKGEEHEP